MARAQVLGQRIRQLPSDALARGSKPARRGILPHFPGYETPSFGLWTLASARIDSRHTDRQWHTSCGGCVGDVRLARQVKEVSPSMCVWPGWIAAAYAKESRTNRLQKSNRLLSACCRMRYSS